MRGLLVTLSRFIMYVLLQVAFIPLALIGLIDGIYREFRISRKLGISFSAIKSLQYRWIMHHFGTRSDPFVSAFTRSFPCESHFGLWMVFGALIIARRLFGFTTSLSRFVEPGFEDLNATAGVRVLHFDRIRNKYAGEMEQMVLLGAGFDLMALHLPEGNRIRVFEVDQTDTMNVKVETLNRAGISDERISYLPVKFAVESWSDKLRSAGFDRTKKTLFIWQSVSLFLEAGDVRNTLIEMADLCTAGSVIAQDFYSELFVSGSYSKAAAKYMRLIESRGEPAMFGLPMTEDPKNSISSFLEGCGLTMTSFRLFGDKLEMNPFYCIVEATAGLRRDR